MYVILHIFTCTHTRTRTHTHMRTNTHTHSLTHTHVMCKQGVAECERRHQGQEWRAGQTYGKQTVR
jgi:hypothetical protein